MKVIYKGSGFRTALDFSRATQERSCGTPRMMMNGSLRMGGHIWCRRHPGQTSARPEPLGLHFPVFLKAWCRDWHQYHLGNGHKWTFPVLSQKTWTFRTGAKVILMNVQIVNDCSGWFFFREIKLLEHLMHVNNLWRYLDNCWRLKMN